MGAVGDRILSGMPAEWSLRSEIENLVTTHGAEVALAELATAQHGQVATGQLKLLGITKSAIAGRRETGRLHQVHQTVWSVGHRHITREGRWMAAVLAAGPDASLSHLSAAQLRGLSPWASNEIHVIARRRMRIPGIRCHRCLLADDERAEIHGIPVTGLSRTLFDCAAILPPYRFEKLLQEAEFRRLTDTHSLDALLRRYPGHRGVARARMVLEKRRFGASITKEEMELRFAKLMDDFGVPSPVFNGLVGAGGKNYEVDVHWPDARLIVELDSRSAHQTTYAFENDRARDRALRVAGWDVVRITWRQLHDEPAKVVADIRALLAAAGAPVS